MADEESSKDVESSIVNFPLLALEKIFKYLPSKDRETSMNVCQRWHDVINFRVGITRFIGKMKYTLPGHKAVTWRPFNVIGSGGIDKCIVGELDAKSLCGDEVPTFMVPELVQEIIFIGLIGDDFFRSLLSSAYWLNSLQIHITVLSAISFTNFSLNLCYLSHLKIFYTHPADSLDCPFSFGPYSKREKVHGNLMKLLNSSYFRRIKIFEFTGPYFIEKAIFLIDAVREFAKRHGVTLKKLVLQFPYEWNLPSVEKNKKNEEMRNETEDKHVSKNWGTMQLTRLVIVCPTTVVPPLMRNEDENEEQLESAWTGNKLNSMWKSLLSNLMHLKFLHYVNKYEDWNFPGFIFSKCFSHLTTVCLSVNSKYNVDCEALAACKNLSKLVLEGNFFYAAEPVDENNNNAIPLDKDEIAGLLNAHCLPPSLKEICFAKLMIPVEEMNIIANMEEPRRFPNLRSLQLYQVCKCVSHCGLTPSAVQTLLDQSNLSVSFWQALNEPSFQKAIGRRLQDVVDSEVQTLEKMLEYCDVDSGIFEDLQFNSLNDCHVKLIRG